MPPMPETTMHREGPEIHLDAEEARAGRKGTFMFKVLMLSLVLIVAAMTTIWLIGSANAPYVPEPVATEMVD